MFQRAVRSESSNFSPFVEDGPGESHGATSTSNSPSVPERTSSRIFPPPRQSRHDTRHELGEEDPDKIEVLPYTDAEREEQRQGQRRWSRASLPSRDENPLRMHPPSPTFPSTFAQGAQPRSRQYSEEPPSPFSPWARQPSQGGFGPNEQRDDMASSPLRPSRGSFGSFGQYNDQPSSQWPSQPHQGPHSLSGQHDGATTPVRNAPAKPPTATPKRNPSHRSNTTPRRPSRTRRWIERVKLRVKGRLRGGMSGRVNKSPPSPRRTGRRSGREFASRILSCLNPHSRYRDNSDRSGDERPSLESFHDTSDTRSVNREQARDHHGSAPLAASRNREQRPNAPRNVSQGRQIREEREREVIYLPERVDARHRPWDEYDANPRFSARERYWDEYDANSRVDARQPYWDEYDANPRVNSRQRYWDEYDANPRANARRLYWDEYDANSEFIARQQYWDQYNANPRVNSRRYWNEVVYPAPRVITAHDVGRIVSPAVGVHLLKPSKVRPLSPRKPKNTPKKDQTEPRQNPSKARRRLSKRPEEAPERPKDTPKNERTETVQRPSKKPKGTAERPKDTPKDDTTKTLQRRPSKFTRFFRGKPEDTPERPKDTPKNDETETLRPSKKPKDAPERPKDIPKKDKTETLQRRPSKFTRFFRGKPKVGSGLGQNEPQQPKMHLPQCPVSDHSHSDVRSNPSTISISAPQRTRQSLPQCMIPRPVHSDSTDNQGMHRRTAGPRPRNYTRDPSQDSRPHDSSPAPPPRPIDTNYTILVAMIPQDAFDIPPESIDPRWTVLRESLGSKKGCCTKCSSGEKTQLTDFPVSTSAMKPNSLCQSDCDASPEMSPTAKQDGDRLCGRRSSNLTDHDSNSPSGCLLFASPASPASPDTFSRLSSPAWLHDEVHHSSSHKVCGNFLAEASHEEFLEYLLSKSPLKSRENYQSHFQVFSFMGQDSSGGPRQDDGVNSSQSRDGSGSPSGTGTAEPDAPLAGPSDSVPQRFSGDTARQTEDPHSDNDMTEAPLDGDFDAEDTTTNLVNTFGPQSQSLPESAVKQPAPPLPSSTSACVGPPSPTLPLRRCNSLPLATWDWDAEPEDETTHHDGELHQYLAIERGRRISLSEQVCGTPRLRQRRLRRGPPIIPLNFAGVRQPTQVRRWVSFWGSNEHVQFRYNEPPEEVRSPSAPSSPSSVGSPKKSLLKRKEFAPLATIKEKELEKGEPERRKPKHMNPTKSPRKVPGDKMPEQNSSKAPEAMSHAQSDPPVALGSYHWGHSATIPANYRYGSLFMKKKGDKSANPPQPRPPSTEHDRPGSTSGGNVESNESPGQHGSGCGADNAEELESNDGKSEMDYQLWTAIRRSEIVDMIASSDTESDVPEEEDDSRVTRDEKIFNYLEGSSDVSDVENDDRDRPETEEERAERESACDSMLRMLRDSSSNPESATLRALEVEGSDEELKARHFGARRERMKQTAKGTKEKDEANRRWLESIKHLTSANPEDDYTDKSTSSSDSDPGNAKLPSFPRGHLPGPQKKPDEDVSSEDSWEPFPTPEASDPGSPFGDERPGIQDPDPASSNQRHHLGLGRPEEYKDDARRPEMTLEQAEQRRQERMLRESYRTAVCSSSWIKDYWGLLGQPLKNDDDPEELYTTPEEEARRRGLRKIQLQTPAARDNPGHATRITLSTIGWAEALATDATIPGPARMTSNPAVDRQSIPGNTLVKDLIARSKDKSHQSNTGASPVVGRINTSKIQEKEANVPKDEKNQRRTWGIWSTEVPSEQQLDRLRAHIEQTAKEIGRVPQGAIEHLMRQMRDPWTRKDFQKMSKAMLKAKLRTFQETPPKAKPIQENNSESPELTLDTMRAVVELTANSKTPATIKQAKSIAEASGSGGRSQSKTAVAQRDIDDPDPSPKVANWMRTQQISRMKDSLMTQVVKTEWDEWAKFCEQKLATTVKTGKGVPEAKNQKNKEQESRRGVLERAAGRMFKSKKRERTQSEGNTVSPRSSVPDQSGPILRIRMTPVKPSNKNLETPPVFARPDPFKEPGQPEGASASTDPRGARRERSDKVEQIPKPTDSAEDPRPPSSGGGQTPQAGISDDAASIRSAQTAYRWIQDDAASVRSAQTAFRIGNVSKTAELVSPRGSLQDFPRPVSPDVQYVEDISVGQQSSPSSQHIEDISQVEQTQSQADDDLRQVSPAETGQTQMKRDSGAVGATREGSVVKGVEPSGTASSREGGRIGTPPSEAAPNAQTQERSELADQSLDHPARDASPRRSRLRRPSRAPPTSSGARRRREQRPLTKSVLPPGWTSLVETTSSSEFLFEHSQWLPNFNHHDPLPPRRQRESTVAANVDFVNARSPRRRIMNQSPQYIDSSNNSIMANSLPRQSPSPGPGHQPNGSGGMPNLVNGLLSGGHQTDVNHLWQVVQQLSDVLAENRSQTANIMNNVQQIQASPEPGELFEPGADYVGPCRLE
ncbi:hypothetical protein HDK77DRAFT_265594 [Phyllosticta capitalensis]